jgi:hypothetical protein
LIQQKKEGLLPQEEMICNMPIWLIGEY